MSTATEYAERLIMQGILNACREGNGFVSVSVPAGLRGTLVEALLESNLNCSYSLDTAHTIIINF